MYDYFIPLKTGKARIEIKRSVFIASTYFVEKENDIVLTLESIKKEHYKANHHCYAYILGNKADVKKASDDGEPSGTAGRPILSVLEATGLTNVLCVVTRYFGGIKLGAAGLLRAYTDAAVESVNKAGIVRKQFCNVYMIKCDYGFYQKLNNYLINMGFAIDSTDFKEEIEICIDVPYDYHQKFIDEIVSMSNGIYNPLFLNSKYIDIKEKAID